MACKVKIIFVHGIGDNKKGWSSGLLPEWEWASCCEFILENELERSAYGRFGEGLQKVGLDFVGESLPDVFTYFANLDKLNMFPLMSGEKLTAKDHLTFALDLKIHNFKAEGYDKFILVGFSLGGAFVDEYMRTLGQYETAICGIVTMGCPQGKTPARQIMKVRSGPPLEPSGPHKVDVCGKFHWINIHGDRDFVAGWPPFSTSLPRKHFPNVTNVEAKGTGHSIEEYLKILTKDFIVEELKGWTKCQNSLNFSRKGG